MRYPLKISKSQIDVILLPLVKTLLNTNWVTF